MRTLEDFLNRLSDQDWGWWPVLFLRPARDRDIDFRALLRITAVSGPTAGFIAYLCRLILQSITTVNFKPLALHMLAGCVIFFIAYRITFAWSWNRRARRLREEERT
jgi:hypothetical protein